MSDPKLCYVEGCFAYFTTLTDIKDQWGDDWDDAPYEHNAGEPYDWRAKTTYVWLVDGKELTSEECRESDFKTRTFLRHEPVPDDQQPERYEIVKVAFDGPFDQPCEPHLNSPFSVEQINAGAVAWLRSPSYAEDPVAIPAGTTLDEFIRIVTSAGGTVYLPTAIDKEVDQ